MALKTNLKFPREFSSNGKIERIMLHHVAGHMTLEEIHAFHIRNGWNGIAYHYFIDSGGVAFCGRPETAQGAGAEGFNYGTIHVCFNGNFDKETMNTKQFRAGQKLVVELMNKFPDAVVLGHKDVNNTACPGANFPLDFFKRLKNGFDVYRNLQLYTNVLDVDGYAAEASKAGIACGAFKDGTGDGMIDYPKSYISRQDFALVLYRLGLFKKE